jgi:hypothetical protein
MTKRKEREEKGREKVIEKESKRGGGTTAK